MLTRGDYLFDPAAQSPVAAPELTMPRLFAEAVARAPGDRAVFAGDGWRTWEQWQTEADALAAALQELGVEPGSVVALHLPNCWEYLTLHVAAASIGAVSFPLHMAFGPYELGLLLERARPKVLVVPDSYRDTDTLALGRGLVDALSEPCTLLATDDVAQLVKAYLGATPEPVPVRPDDPLALMTSSGTSSVRPKLCVHTHGGQLGNAAATAADGAARAGDTLLSCSPFTHLFGLLSIHLSLVMGGRQALLPRWSVDGLLEVATRARASVVFAVPAQLRDVVASGSRLRLREVRTGGAPVPADLVTSIRDVLGAGVVVQWGMSEVGAGTYTRPGDPTGTVAATIGRPVSGAQARIVGDDGAEPPAGEVGEVWYRSPTMFRGYLGDPEHTAEAVTEDGWLRTGDLASWTADGNLAYRGRRTEFLNRGGMKFSAVEVENLLAELPELAQFAILDEADDRLGQRAVLVAALRPGHRLTLDRVTEHLRGRGLAKYKWPEKLLVVDELPTTPTGKIARVRLKHLILDGGGEPG
jgi:acyl-CoA synthetase (AMP-forming)/AMP-acid ligase II